MARPVPRAYWICFAAFMLLSGLMIVAEMVSEPPPLDQLQPRTVALWGRLQKVTPGARSTRGPYAEFRWTHGRARLANLCFLSDCDIPPALAALRAGDRVDLWVKDGVVWQVGPSSSPLVAYPAAVTAFRAATRRQLAVIVPAWILLGVLGTVGVSRWRRRG